MSEVASYEFRDQFGRRLRALREQRNVSLDRLASLSGVSKAYLWKLEKRPNPNPSIATLEKLAGALETTAEKLLLEPSPQGSQAAAGRRGVHGAGGH